LFKTKFKGHKYWNISKVSNQNGTELISVMLRVLDSKLSKEEDFLKEKQKRKQKIHLIQSISI
jgi:hypothetical protein